MGEQMVSDQSIQVLAERVSAAMDDIKEMKGKVDAMHIVSNRLSGVERDVISIDRKADVALAKTDRMDDTISKMRSEDLEPIKVEIAGARRAWKWVSALGTGAFLIAGGIYSQWHPWMDDLNKAKAARDEQLSKYQYDVGTELRRDDNRLTVLEFRANNIDQKATK